MRLRELALATALAVGSPASHACGPWFPAQLLDDRAGSLANLPEGTFAFEARRLVSPPPHWTVVEHADWLFPQTKVTQESIEREWWGDQYERVDGLRKAANAAAAYEQGKDLPEEARRYMAGAVAFSKDYDEAIGRFRSVLELPPDQRTHYGVWAQYMIATMQAGQESNDIAHAEFKATRDLVAAGAADPLGLAATSLGDEAKLYLDAHDDAAAIALYAEQAAAGSEFGRTSLLWVASAIIRDEARLDRALADPLAQQLMTIYLLTRSAELSESPYDEAVDPRAAEHPPIDPAVKIERLLAAVERIGLDHIAGADRLAALAYRSGRYDLAGQLAVKDTSGLAWWVRAKLALRAGDVAAAEAAYARAAKAFPPDETWGTTLQEDVSYFDVTRPQCRVQGEQAILALVRGEYVGAMEYLYNAASVYWTDAAFVAERVLTLDELKHFVEAHAAQPSPPQTKKNAGEADQDYGGEPIDRVATLRALLARRLLRADRFDEALAYFDNAELKAKAQRYVAARREAQHGDSIEQAQAWFKAATSARQDGIDLIGYELAPDFQTTEGDFEYVTNFAGAESDKKTPAALPLTLTSRDETERTSASAAVPPRRFHYRYTAATFAARAADLLPPRSQAFAAVLCHATAYVIDRDSDAASRIYRRYLRQGPYVAWGEAFGRDCPEPDFAAAEVRLHAERVAHYRHLARRSLPYAAVTCLGAGAGLLAAFLLRRRRKSAAPESPGT